MANGPLHVTGVQLTGWLCTMYYFLTFRLCPAGCCFGSLKGNPSPWSSFTPFTYPQEDGDDVTPARDKAIAKTIRGLICQSSRLSPFLNKCNVNGGIVSNGLPVHSLPA